MALRAHPFAQMVPMMDDEQFEKLLADIVANGQLEPIVLFEGLILDGRHRMMALERCGSGDVKTVAFEGTRLDAFVFVMGKNLHRRHMNATQRAFLAAQILDTLETDSGIIADAKETTIAMARVQTLREVSRRWIERPHLSSSVVWPPPEGFPPSAPETLKAFARSKGVENVALVPMSDERDFDTKKEMEAARALGLTEADFPKDEPAPEKCSIDWTKESSWTGGEVSGTGARNPQDKDKGGRPRNLRRDAIENIASDWTKESSWTGGEVSGTGARNPQDKDKGGRPRNLRRDAIENIASVSRRTAQRLDRVLRTATPEVKEALNAGRVSLKKAEKISSPSKDQQAQLPPKTNSHERRLRTAIVVLVDINNTPSDWVNRCSPKALRELAQHAAKLPESLETVVKNQ